MASGFDVSAKIHSIAVLASRANGNKLTQRAAPPKSEMYASNNQLAPWFIQSTIVLAPAFQSR
jgi:hypothetical protein